jgi:hypothetical protein
MDRTYRSYRIRTAAAALALLASTIAYAAAPQPPADILGRLQAVPGLSVAEQRSPHPDYRFFVMTLDQPADHDRPGSARFQQRVTLLHKDSAAPMVLYAGGYDEPPYFGRSELTRILGSNQITIEHRFFGTSIPSATDWSTLNIRQSAADFHRIVEALKPIYGARWLSTGGSKGGETVVFHRRFYPDDVYATVAYVAPIPARYDLRFVYFMDHVGDAGCRNQLHRLQQSIIDRKAELLPLLKAEADASGLTFEHLGIDRAYEHVVEESYVAFWQYGGAAFCPSLPAPDAAAGELVDFILNDVGLYDFSDPGIDQYEAYYYQAATQIGYPAPYDYFLRRLTARGSDIPEYYVKHELPAYDYLALLDVQLWVALQGERLLFIYGSDDPWSSAQYRLGAATDSYEYIVPGGNHGSGVWALDAATQATVRETLSRWSGVTALALSPQQQRTLARKAIDLSDPPMPPRGPLRYRTLQ